jgi:hypothetical protein
MYDQQKAEIVKYAKEVGAKYPHLKAQIQDFFDLCQSEIEDGASPSNEYDLLLWDIKEMEKNQQNLKS